jgi:hypothetical protein
LFVGALLLLNTVRNLSQVPLGFDPDGVATFGVSPQQLGYTPEAAYRYAQEFARRLRATHGIQSVVVSEGATPFTDANGSTRVRLAGDARNATLQRPLTATLWTTDYFETMRIPIRRGRVFDLEDLGSPARPARRVVVVNEQLAHALFGSIDAAVGQSIEFAVRGATGPCEVIGVVGNARYQSLTAAFDAMVYEPAGLEAWTRPSATITLRTSAPLDTEAVVRDIGSALDPSLAVPPVTSLAESIATRGRAAQDFLSSLLGALAVIAAVLSTLGVYALVSFGVATRRREFGIRAAVGAAPAALRRLVLRRTATLTGIGLVIGLGGAYALAKTLESRLFGVLPFDPLVWTMAACGLVVVSFGAALIPAQGASASDPMRALREL